MQFLMEMFGSTYNFKTPANILYKCLNLLLSRDGKSGGSDKIIIHEVQQSV